jgi:hypothetical protein
VILIHTLCAKARGGFISALLDRIANRHDLNVIHLLKRVLVRSGSSSASDKSNSQLSHIFSPFVKKVFSKA